MSVSSAGGFRVAAMVGSLRQGSLNRLLLRATMDLAPAGIEVFEVPIYALPFYNPEDDVEGAVPAAVVTFREELSSASALLIVTPEYNYSVPAVIKNALDWASRPARADAPLFEMPVGIMGASPGNVGTARAQEQLKLILLATGALPLVSPVVLMNQAKSKFDSNGHLRDEADRQRVVTLLQRLEEWARRFQGEAVSA